MLLLGDILRRHARYRPGKLAYVIGDARVSYGDFNRTANRLAHLLLKHGVRRGDRVAVLANNCPEYPALYFAAVKIGAIVVPVNARFKAEEIAYVVDHSGAATIVVAEEFAGALGQARAQGGLARVGTTLHLGYDVTSALATASDADPDVFVHENDPHVMLYTSGTTGRPKGAVLTQRAYYLQAGNNQIVTGLTEDDTGLSMFPMFHMGGWALPLGLWYNGGTVVIMRKADPRAILEAVQNERVTYLYAVPTVYNFMLSQSDFRRFDCSSLRIIASGTATMTRAQVLGIMEAFGCERLFIMYGSTEAGPVAVLRARDVRRKPETVGLPAPNVDVRLVSADGHDVGNGETGEIAVRSEFTMREYWHAPNETARTIRDGWVHTGDLATRDEEGFLTIVGRLKEVIRSGGESILPVEVERVLLSHPAIVEAAVVGLPDPDWGEAVAAAVVLRAGDSLDADSVVGYVRERLAGFKKPKYVFFLDELPRTAASRQVRKPLLREMLLQRLT